MKILLNCDWGGWAVPEDLEEELSYESLDSSPKLRYSKKIIDFVEGNPNYSGSLEVFDLPEDATDYKIIQYDGQEDVIYCKNGRLYWLRGYFNE